jgi:hypothetical protein
MKILPVLLLALVLAACGSDDDSERGEPAARETPTATQAPADAEADIREVFDDYNDALAERDWADACEQLAPETTDKLRQNAGTLGLKDLPEDCAGLLGTVYETADKDPQQKALLREIVKSAKVDSVKVDGDTATINWSATVQGQNTPISQTARRIDGEWKLVDVTN